MRSDDTSGTLVADLRAHSLTDFARDAQRLRRVDAITAHVHATEAWQLGLPALRCATRSGRLTVHDLDEIAADEVAAATGLARWHAEREVQAARRLCRVLTRTLGALERGLIDGARARVVAAETEGLTDDLARRVEATVLDALPAEPLQGTGPVGPWDGPQPRAFTARVRTAVASVRTDDEEVVRRDVRERTGTWVQVDPTNPALATLTVTGPTEQVVAIADTVETRARSLSVDELGGRTLGMAAVDALHDAVLGDGHTGTTGTRRELGVVLHADTLLDDGDAAEAPGEVRGVGAPVACHRRHRPGRRRRPAGPRRHHLRPAHRRHRPPRPAPPRRQGTGQRVDPRHPRAGHPPRAGRPAARPPRDRHLRTDSGDRRDRPGPRPGLHLPRLRRPRRPLRPRPHRPPPTRPDLGREPQPEVAPLPPLEDRRSLARPGTPRPTRPRRRARVDQPPGTRQVVEVRALPGC